MTVTMALLLHISHLLSRHYWLGVLIRLLLDCIICNNGPLVSDITVIIDPVLPIITRDVLSKLAMK